MASISTDADGKRRILFVNPNGERKQIRLGKVPMKTAQTIKTRVENILAAQLAGHAIDGDTATWLGERDSVLYGKLAAVGLVQPRDLQPVAQAIVLGNFLDQYIASRADVKPGTETNLKQARKKLVEYFGESKPLGAITPGDADQFRQDLESK